MQENTAHKIVAGIESRRYLLLALFTAIYGLCAVGRAGGKPFWYDEVITLIAAKAPDLGAVWKATLATDANPPLPHLLTHLSIRWLGVSEVSARLPAIVGFWTLCLCLYVFVARRKGVVYGLCALLMPAMTRAYYYSAEARAYGLELGFCGLVLICWQAAAERRHRAVALCGLALSLSAMMLCHYYAVLMYLPLAGGELLRARRLRRPDWGMWLALAAGGAPLVWRVTTILGVVKGFSHTWAPAYLRQGVEFWETGLAPGAAFAALLVGVLAMVTRRGQRQEEDGEAGKVPEHEWAAVVLLVAVPLAGVMGGLLVTHMFNERYALIGLAGFCAVTPMVAAEVWGRRGVAGVAMLGVLAWGMVVRSLDHPNDGNPFERETVLREALEQGPVVIPDGQLFLQMWQYAPERLKPQLVYVADDAAALKYMGYDTIEGGIRVLRPWGVNVREWGEFAHATREFTAYQTSLRPGWVLSQVVADGATVEIRKTALYRELVRVRLRD